MKTISISALAPAAALVWALVLMSPTSAFAAPSSNAFLGGGNALSRALNGQSQGLAHATSTADLLTRLQFASVRGGHPEETPPADGSDDQNSDGSDDAGDTGAADQAGANANAHANPGNGNNGGAQGGNGGNGADGGPSGLIRAGSVVSNSTAVNAINTALIRFNSR